MSGKYGRSAVPVLRLITAAGLAVDAYVHIDLAAQYDGNKGSGFISQGLLFRAEAGAAILAALLILVSGRRILHVPAFLVAATAITVLLVYRYVDIGTLGPLPDMYDPTWYTEKTISAIAETLATLTAAALLILSIHPSAIRGDRFQT